MDTDKIVLKTERGVNNIKSCWKVKEKKWGLNIPGGVSDLTNSRIMRAENRLVWAEQWVGIQEKDTAITLLEKSVQSEKIRKKWVVA